ncbi:MAG: glycoside hydrolase family 13 protein [Ruminiclostridium sp.]|nr:glycoside hydrolase family 13 protein [Ruminiclostridium sp.]
MKPIFDCFLEEYKSPFGAIEQGTECRFVIKFPADTMVEEPMLVMFRPGFKERFIKLEKADTVDGITAYKCVYVPNDLGLHHYYFSLLINHSRHYVKKNGASVGVIDNGDLFQLTVYERGMTTPEWLKGGIMYQIFPDRFAKSGIQHENVPYDRNIHANWDEIPDWRPDVHGNITNSDYFGGDLKGIEQKLDYIASLGCNVIYLNPIFEAHENHRYCTADYSKIDPLLGTEEDFVSLCKAASEKGIRIILDGVFSHTGADSIYFNKTGRYGEHTGAFRDPESPYREWYSFSDYPNVYESWWGITTLPNVIENNPAYTKYICGEGGILQKWIDLGASGWRLDVADELPDEFIDNLNKSVKSKGSEYVIYGEVWEDATNKESYGVRRRYLIGGQLDSVMNYPFKEAVLNYIKGGDARTLVDGVMTIVEHYPKPSTDILMNFLTTHDTERAITRLAGEDVGWNGREWQSQHQLSNEQYAYGIALMKCAMVLQFFLPGIPSIYYADEAGKEGYKDPFNRATYPWGSENDELIDFTRELGRIRRANKVFARGTIRFIDVTSDYAIFEREDKSLCEKAIIIMNRSKYKLCRKVSEFAGNGTYETAHGRCENGIISTEPFGYSVITVKEQPAEITL